jgi:hypothetical protein
MHSTQPPSTSISGTQDVLNDFAQLNNNIARAVSINYWEIFLSEKSHNNARNLAIQKTAAIAAEKLKPLDPTKVDAVIQHPMMLTSIHAYQIDLFTAKALVTCLQNNLRPLRSHPRAEESFCNAVAQHINEAVKAVSTMYSKQEIQQQTPSAIVSIYTYVTFLAICEIFAFDEKKACVTFVDTTPLTSENAGSFFHHQETLKRILSTAKSLPQNTLEKIATYLCEDTQRIQTTIKMPLPQEFQMLRNNLTSLGVNITEKITHRISGTLQQAFSCSPPSPPPESLTREDFEKLMLSASPQTQYELRTLYSKLYPQTHNGTWFASMIHALVALFFSRREKSDHK